MNLSCAFALIKISTMMGSHFPKICCQESLKNCLSGSLYSRQILEEKAKHSTERIQCSNAVKLMHFMENSQELLIPIIQKF